MSLAQLKPERDYDKRHKSTYEASSRASEFLKGIEKITEHLDASHFSVAVLTSKANLWIRRQTTYEEA